MSFLTEYKDREFERIIAPILEIEEFKEMKNIVHHGMNRYDHCLRVGYYSYRLAKFLHLNYEETARAAILHDFFLTDLNPNSKMKNLVNHPKTAIENAENFFDLTDREKDIISTHMFPVAPKIPKYAESWIVDLVDDVAGIYEKCYSLNKKLIHNASYFLLLVMLNGLK